MSFPLNCKACGARLKLPPGCTKKKARCPKCNAKVDLTAALNATAYRPDGVSSVLELPDAAVAATAKLAAPAKPVLPAKAPPLPSARPTTPPRPAPPPLPYEREEDPLPYQNLNPTARRAPDPPLTIDEDAPPAKPDAAAPAAPAAPPPFRTSARVTADSANLFAGPCDAVLLPHGIFLESIPFRPFLYIPLRSPVDRSGRSLIVRPPDGRSITVQFVGANARRVAEDAAAFIAGERPLPEAKEYRTKPLWLLGVACIFAVGLAVGPLALSHATEFDLQTGLVIAGGFAGVGLLANAAVALLTRLSVPGKVVLMATISAVVTGVFLLAASAYLAGRKHEADRAKEDAPPPHATTPSVKPPDPPPDPEVVRRRGLPTALDVAYTEGRYRFDDGPDDATAIGVTPDGVLMLVGYKNGATRVWRFDQLTIDPFAPGPKADGPVTRVEFDSTMAIAYLSCNGGTVAANWNTPPPVPVKIPGDAVAPFAFPGGERFAAYRRNALVLKQVPTDLLNKADGKSKDFRVLLPTEEAQPADLKGPLTPPNQRPSFLAWHPTGKLLAGQPNGGILNWGAGRPRPEPVATDHKALVRAWASSPSTWDFATGDDKGMVGLWENRSMTPRVFLAASAGGFPTAITHLAFSPSGSHLAVADAANVVWVWDLAERRAIVKTSRPTPVRGLAFGPHDDTIMLTEGKGVELWMVSELAKQP